MARLLLPSLTTVRVDTAGLGRYVADLALQLASDGPLPSGGPETRAVLVRRESTA